MFCGLGEEERTKIRKKKKEKKRKKKEKKTRWEFASKPSERPTQS